MKLRGLGLLAAAICLSVFAGCSAGGSDGKDPPDTRDTAAIVETEPTTAKPDADNLGEIRRQNEKKNNELREKLEISGSEFEQYIEAQEKREDSERVFVNISGE